MALRKLLQKIAPKFATDVANYRKTFYQLEQLAYQQGAAFIQENIKDAVLLTDVRELWAYAIERSPKSGFYLEFGVFSGTSINFFASEMRKKTTETIYGFDSFEGLSEFWSGTNMTQGTFKTNKLPKVASNVQLEKGLVADTLPGFVAQNDFEQKKIAFIHFDFDIYGPTKFAFEMLKPYFQKGTIVVFDELLGYPGWKENEYKVLQEVLNPEEYKFIAFCEPRDGYQSTSFVKAAIEIL